MNMCAQALIKLRSALLIILIIVSPFHAFFITWIKSMPLSVWREVIVAAIVLIIVIEFIIKNYSLLFDSLDFVIFAYFLLALLWLPLQLDSQTQWLLGMRYDVMPFVFLAAVRHVEWPKKELLWRVALITSGVVLIFGLLHALILPQNFLTHFGYSQNQSTYEQGIAISSCQYLEHTDRVCRATSAFGGPTRYGTYVLLTIGLLIGWYGIAAHGGIRRRNQILAALFVLLALANGILTYSRSIWIALISVGIFAFFWFVPQKKLLKIIAAGFAALITGALLWLLFSFMQKQMPWSPPPFIKTIFVRETSSGEHAALFIKGLQTVREHPLGIGLGTVGPASIRFEKFLTENWYLQIADEMGIPGLLLFLAILFLLGKKLLAKRGNLSSVGLFIALLGISIAGLFTHSFEETSTMLILVAFIGMQLPVFSSRN